MTEDERKSIVIYRMENSKNTMSEIQSHIDNKFYNTAINRMYYACFYAVSALLVANEVEVKSHDGVRRQFNLHFVSTGVVPIAMGQFYSQLLSQRTSGDYEDFLTHNEETVADYFPRCKEFLETIYHNLTIWLDAH